MARTGLRAVRQERIAVLLNANARSVTESVRNDLARFIPADDIFYSRSFEDCQSISRQVLERGYDVVLTGGGDGTFCGFANTMLDLAGAQTSAGVAGALRLAPERVRLPRFGVLRLGTGNSLADMTGASPKRAGLIEDVLRTQNGEPTDTFELRLLDVEGKRAPFAGLGIDGLVLNDYIRLKKLVGLGPLQKLVATSAGYVVSGVLQTAPRLALSRPVEVEVVNEGEPASQLAPDGRAVGRPIDRGEVVFRGKLTLVCAGTVPNYGFGFQIFPFAHKSPGRFQLRLSALSALGTLGILPQIWRGQTPKAGVLDFQCDRVRLKFARPMPLQIGGDAEGYRDELVLGMSPDTVQLVDFTRR